MSQSQQVTDFVSPDCHGFAIRETSVCLWMDGNPSVKVQAARKLRQGDNQRAAQVFPRLGNSTRCLETL
jgi:hypothetical protein